MYLARRLLALALAALLLPTAASAQKILRYSDHEPLGGMRTRFIKDVFFAAIEKESNGRLKVEDRWDSVVSTGYDALRVLGEGKLADMAIVVPEYMAKDLPLHQLFKGFPSGPTGDKQVAFFRRAYAEIPALGTELDKNQVVPVFLATGYPVAFFSNRAIDNLGDIKGQKWRSASFWHHDFLRNAGATPVSMPWGEPVFKAMRDKTMDGLMVNVDSGYMLKVHEVAPHVLLSKDLWLGHLYVLAMNRATWNGLAPEDQQAIQRAAETAYKTLGQVMDRSFDAQVDDLKKAGVKLRLLDPKELAAWNTTTNYQAVQATWARDQENKGVKDAVQVLKQVDALHGAMTK
jgi:TRAP-type C4-dicarboxylate transport system substrate-binding protein